MSRARHRARGGSVTPVVFAGEGSNNLKEARERKRGGKVTGEGTAPKLRADRPARGRQRGGRIGADKAPLSSAAKIKEITPGEQPEGGNKSN